MVVKFGGSLLERPERAALLACALAAGAIVVPGGGRFADAVRRAQAADGFSDEAAHAEAIRAMDRTAQALHDDAPASPLCATREALAAALARNTGAIWRPSPMALAADLPASWDVTSDSIALWLAITLSARRLVVLKAAAVDSSSDIESLAADGIVDPYMPALATRFAGEIAVVGPAAPALLERALDPSARRAA